MALYGLDLVTTSKVDKTVASHDPNMALGGSATVLQKIFLQYMGPNGLNILPAGLQDLTPEANLDVHGPSRIHVAGLHIPPNQNAPPIGLVPVQPGSRVLVISDGI